MPGSHDVDQNKPVRVSSPGRRVLVLDQMQTYRSASCPLPTYADLLLSHTVHTSPEGCLALQSVQEDFIRRLGPSLSIPPAINELSCRFDRSDVAWVTPVVSHILQLWNLIGLV